MAAPSNIYYASTTGGGSAAGTIGDPGSLTRAITLARAWIAAGNSNCLILCRAGTYYLSASIDTTSADAGITIQPYPTESVTFSGGTAITGAWSAPDGNGVYSKLISGTFRDLWVNGIRATRARSGLNPTGFTRSADGFTDADSNISALARPQDVEIVGKNEWKMFKVRVSTAVGTAVTVNATDWANSQFQASDNLELQSVWWYENAQELVQNGQGYWYHNRNTNTLYYKPRTGETMGSVEVIAGNLERLVKVTDAPGGSALNLNFRGITFSHATLLDPDSHGWIPLQANIQVRASDGSSYAKHFGAIKLYGANAVNFYGCTFSHMGGVGLSMDYGTSNCIVNNCSFSDIGATAITVGDVTHLTADPWPSDSHEILSNNRIFNCLIDGAGAVYYDSCGIWAAYPSALTVDQNTLQNLPYTGISIGWGWGLNDPPGYGSPLSGWPAGITAAPSVATACANNSVTKNKILEFMQQLADAGAIYMNSAQSGSLVDSNYAYQTTAAAGNLFHYYLDNGARYITVTNNVKDGSGASWAAIQIFAAVAKDNTVTNNYANSGSIWNSGAVDPSNTVSSNTVGALGATALAIKTNAGRM